MIWDTTYDIRFQTPNLTFQDNAENSWELRPGHGSTVKSLAEELNGCGEYGENDWSSEARSVMLTYEKGRSTENRVKAKISPQ